FGRAFRSATRGLARMDAPTGSIVAFSTAPGSVAADGSGRNGTYTKYLLQYLPTPGMKIEELLKQVRNEVLRETNRQQTPWESTSLTGDFFFVTASAAPPGVVRPSPAITPVSPPVTPPAPGTVPDYDRVIREREQAEKQWASWQARMEAEFAKAQTYDQNPRLKPQEKAGLWQAFLSGFAQDNPNSAKDEELRIKAQGRLDHWQKQASVPAPAPQVAAITPSATDATRTITGLLKYANGVIFDPKTNLEWYVGPDRDTSWNDADQWVRSLSVGGFGWCLPTRDELRGLYKKGVGSRNRDPAFETTGGWVWSEARDSSSAWGFTFNDGDADWSYRHNVARAFAVRSRR
ncbi:MAG: caspase family protein, partial [Pseudomonadota bacterium]